MSALSDDALAGRVALVTGASSGIGSATAHALAAAGADVAVVARREKRLEELAAALESQYGVDARAVPTDVTDESAVEEMVTGTVDAFDRLDVLVNNAGVGLGDDVEEMDTGDYRTMMATNVDGTFFATRAALSHLRETEGNLVFVGSFAGRFPRSFNPVYAATKWWVRGFAASVGAQVGDDGVAVTVINPSEVRTEFGSETGEPFEQRFERGTVTEPEEVGAAIAFAVAQPSAVAELDLYRRDKLTMF